MWLLQRYPVHLVRPIDLGKEANSLTSHHYTDCMTYIAESSHNVCYNLLYLKHARFDAANSINISFFLNIFSTLPEQFVYDI